MAVVGEMLSEGALKVNLNRVFLGLNNLRILRGLVLNGDKPTNVEVYADRSAEQTDEIIVTAELYSRVDNKKIIHAMADVVLGKKLPKTVPASDLPKAHMVYTNSMSSAYEQFLFHGEFLQAITNVEGWSPEGIIADIKSSKSPSEWFEKPFSNSWHTDPLAVDAAFQLMILWTNQEVGLPSLPNIVKTYRQYADSFPKTGVKILSKILKKSNLSATANIDFVDKDNNLIARIEGYECTMNESLKQAFKRSSISEAQ